MNFDQIKVIADNFAFEGEFFFFEPFGCGHINSTYAVYYKSETKPPRRYILQKINVSIFTKPLELMENIERVTEHLREKSKASGGDYDRETLTVVKTKDGNNLHIENGEYYRAYIFIENATCYQNVERPVLFLNAAKSFGKFQRLLADFDASKLHETIEKFHDTGNRYKNFIEAVNNNVAGRLDSVKAEVEFVKAREADCYSIIDKIKSGEIPLRVTHNDTKLNNIMIDNKTDDGICVIDLDTVMPGSVLYDFGDSIRFGASSGAEDEVDLSKIYMDIKLFESYTEGFLIEVRSALKKSEIDNLAWSAKILTLECGIRFLTDYLNGDTYFKIHREHQNLDRTRTQFKLVADMENKMDEMNKIVAKYAK